MGTFFEFQRLIGIAGLGRWNDRAIRLRAYDSFFTEPYGVCRRPVGHSYAAMSGVTRAAPTLASASAGGMSRSVRGDTGC